MSPNHKVRDILKTKRKKKKISNYLAFFKITWSTGMGVCWEYNSGVEHLPNRLSPGFYTQH